MRSFASLSGVAPAAALAAALMTTTPAAQDPATGPLLVGTADGTLTALRVDAEGRPAGVIATATVDDALRFVARHPRLPLVYVAGDRRLFTLAWQAEQRRFAFRSATPIAVRATHVDVAPDGRHLAIASYGDHAVAVLALGDDGVPTGVAHRLGTGDDPTFRNAHQVRFAPDSRALHVPCLGADHVASIVLDEAAPRLAATATTPDGAGPRHLDFHPSLPLAYALNELQSSITVLRATAATGTLTPLDTTTALPADSATASRSSDIHVEPRGRFLLAIHREPRDEIVTMAIDAEGALRATHRTPTGGRHARTFAISAAGDRAWVGNTWSADVTAFAIADDGALRALGEPWPAGGPVQTVLAPAHPARD